MELVCVSRPFEALGESPISKSQYHKGGWDHYSVSRTGLYTDNHPPTQVKLPLLASCWVAHTTPKPHDVG